MSFVANVFTVLIASPGDVAKERVIAVEEIHRWNAANGRVRQLVLSPMRWETHSSPRMGAHPQTVLNDQVLAYADIVVGIFGTRIGTATPDYISGSVEEINRHVKAGKLAMVYFSRVPVDPTMIDAEQLKALQAFKAECRTRGLYYEFETEEQFSRDFGHHLTLELNKPEYTSIEHPPGFTQGEPALPSLSDVERELLAAFRADPNGIALHVTTFQGFSVNTNGVSFGDGTPRTTAALKHGLHRLRALGYISPAGKDIDQMTADGYARADQEAAHQA